MVLKNIAFVAITACNASAVDDSLHHDKVTAPMPNIQTLLHPYYAATV